LPGEEGGRSYARWKVTTEEIYVCKYLKNSTGTWRETDLGRDADYGFDRLNLPGLQRWQVGTIDQNSDFRGMPGPCDVSHSVRRDRLVGPGTPGAGAADLVSAAEHNAQPGAAGIGAVRQGMANLEAPPSSSIGSNSSTACCGTAANWVRRRIVGCAEP
jgi:hypothetical protein